MSSSNAPVFLLYPPGTYAFRAASVRGNDESDPTAPVMVVVP